LLICIDCNVAQPKLISFDMCHKAAVFVSLSKDGCAGAFEETGSGSSFNPQSQRQWLC
jgi:hypothetical protein